MMFIYSDNSTLMQSIQLTLTGQIPAATTLSMLLWILSALNFARRAMRREDINYPELTQDIQIFLICFAIMLYFSNIIQ